MPTTPTTRRVKLKRVSSLRRGDIVSPSLGLFSRKGERLSRPSLASGPWEVDLLELDSSGMWVIELTQQGTRAVVWAPADSYVVLA